MTEHRDGCCAGVRAVQSVRHSVPLIVPATIKPTHEEATLLADNFSMGDSFGKATTAMVKHRFTLLILMHLRSILQP